MNRQDKIFVAGHNGLVGSAIVRSLKARGYANVLTCDRRQCDLTRQAEVESWLGARDIDCIFLAAAKVGGIQANATYKAEFIYQNLAIATNVVHAAYLNGVKKLLYLGSSCVYPRDCPQPMREEYLLTGPLEATNEPYAVAKIAGLKMVQAYNYQYGTRYLSLMPTNLYGVNDNFDAETSHVLPALIRKITAAKAASHPQVVLWGSGTPKREFLFVDDLADACIFCLDRAQNADLLNVGSGEEVTIRELAGIIAEVIGYDGNLTFDPSMPDGTPRKLLDSSRLTALGWRPRVTLREGVERTYRWYLEHRNDSR